MLQENKKQCEVCENKPQEINFENRSLCRTCAVEEAQSAYNENHISLLEATENAFIDNETNYGFEEVICEVADKIDNMDNKELEQFLNGEGW